MRFSNSFPFKKLLGLAFLSALRKRIGDLIEKTLYNRANKNKQHRRLSPSDNNNTRERNTQTNRRTGATDQQPLDLPRIDSKRILLCASHRMGVVSSKHACG
jgi:hypothetical protein